MQIDAVIVTFNRLSLLKKCLSAVLEQTQAIENIFVIDNNSTDDTWIYLQKCSKKYPQVKSVHMTKNLGGAGGFNVGIKKFINDSDSNYVWLMDDDTIPTKSSLERLVDKIPPLKSMGFLASNVRWIDGSPAAMNVPVPEKNWKESTSTDLLKVRAASFVSILFSRESILEVGYPVKDFFIWGDDIEYTRRVNSHSFQGYMVKDSVVVHEIKQNIPTDLVSEEDIERIERYFYSHRNRIYNEKKYGGFKGISRALFSQMFIQPIKSICIAQDYKFFRAWISIKGTCAGLIFNPKIEKT